MKKRVARVRIQLAVDVIYSGDDDPPIYRQAVMDAVAQAVIPHPDSVIALESIPGFSAVSLMRDIDMVIDHEPPPMTTDELMNAMEVSITEADDFDPEDYVAENRGRMAKAHAEAARRYRELGNEALARLNAERAINYMCGEL